jgi:hypothetical protein
MVPSGADLGQMIRRPTPIQVLEPSENDL